MMKLCHVECYFICKQIQGINFSILLFKELQLHVHDRRQGIHTNDLALTCKSIQVNAGNAANVYQCAPWWTLTKLIINDKPVLYFPIFPCSIVTQGGIKCQDLEGHIFLS